MDGKSRVPALRVITVSLTGAGLLSLAGCSLDKNGVQPGKTFARIGGHSGEILEPKRCLLKVAIISRPFDDAAINRVVWKAADEQIIPPKERRAWEANGLRVGRITGELPLELEAIMNDSTSHQRVSPTDIIVESGEPTLIKVSDPVEQASLLLNRDNRAFGHDYTDVSGYFRATAQHDGPNNVVLRLVPELHFGPIQRTFQTVPSAAAIGPQEFKINNGQEEDTIRELATSFALAPGQVAVIGCRPEQKRGLGTFFFTQPVAHSDQRLEKLVLIWATRNLQGVGPDERSQKASDRPTLLKRLAGTPRPPSPSRATQAPVEPPTAGVDMMLVDPAPLKPAPATNPPAAKPVQPATNAPSPDQAKPSP